MGPIRASGMGRARLRFLKASAIIETRLLKILDRLLMDA